MAKINLYANRTFGYLKSIGWDIHNDATEIIVYVRYGFPVVFVEHFANQEDPLMQSQAKYLKDSRGEMIPSWKFHDVLAKSMNLPPEITDLEFKISADSLPQVKIIAAFKESQLFPLDVLMNPEPINEDLVAEDLLEKLKAMGFIKD